jgi:tetratricopeptide (TPR) repeat protein
MKPAKILFTGTSLFLLLTLFFGCGERVGEKEFIKAKAAQASGDLVQARLHYEKAIKRLSGEHKAAGNHQLGLVCWKLQDTDAAIKAFQAACELSDEGITESNLNLAAAYFQAGDLQQAEVELNRILNRSPNHAGALTLKGLIAMSRNDWTTASSSIQEGLANAPDSPAAQNLIAISEDLQKNRNSDSAIARLKSILQTDPTFAPALFNLGAIYDHWKADPKQALSWYEKYLATQSTDSALANVARKAIERYSTGMEPIRTTTPRTDPVLAQRFIAEGARYHANRKYREALEAYRKATEADPTNADAFYNNGLTHYALAEYVQAADSFSQALKLTPSNESTRYMLAASLHGQKRYREADKEIKELLRINPSHQQGLALQQMIQNLLR